jgi:hypothetical protein
LSRRNCRQLSNPIPEIINQDQRAAPAFDRAELADFDRFIERRATGARDFAGLFDCES